MKNAYNICGRKSEGKRPLGKRRRRWEDNIRLYLKEIGWEGVDCIRLPKDRCQWPALVDTVMNLQDP